MLLSACAAHDARLIGRWRSNRALTVDTLAHATELRPAKRALLEGVFGRLTLTYTPRAIDCSMPAKAAEQPYRERIAYRVIASDAASITLVLKGASLDRNTTQVIHFDGPDRFWVALGKRGGREYFDRLGR
jgi:hypothetical protein